MPKCRYYKKMKTKGYFRCLRDNSIRRRKENAWSYLPCKCPYLKYRFIDRLVGWRE